MKSPEIFSIKTFRVFFFEIIWLKMKLRDSALKISILISLLHCVLGNIVGPKTDITLIEILFMPYTFIAGMSDFSGWSLLSVVFEIAGLIIMTIIFYPIGLLIEKKENK
jgi:hypothetical protein